MPSYIRIIQAFKCAEVLVDESAHDATLHGKKKAHISGIDVNELLKTRHFTTYDNSETVQVVDGVISYIEPPLSSKRSDDTENAEVAALTQQAPKAPEDINKLVKSLSLNGLLRSPRPISSCKDTGNFIEGSKPTTVTRPASV